MAFYNAFTRIGVSIQSQQGSGTVHGQRRAWQWIYNESPATMCQTSENGQDM